MTRSLDGVFGQDAEVAALDHFLDEVERGPATVLLEGEVGAGKTTLLRAVVAAARRRGHRVLACHPAEAEASLAFAAFGDLLQGVLAGPRPPIPEPQLRALRVAVLLEDPDGPPPDQRSVSVATLALIRSLETRGPVLVAVDEYQWLDAATARVLEFALRRLETERVGFVAALRRDDGKASRVPPGADGLGPGARRVSPAPLDVDALDALFRARLDDSFPRPILRQIREASGGNPLFAIEIARAVHAGEVRAVPGQRLPVPRTLRRLVEDRLGALPTDVRELLFLAAALSDPTVDLLDRATPGADASRRLDVAVRAGIAELDAERVRFTHPLFASTLYHSVGAAERRVRHARLAQLLVTPDERARQLSLAAEGPSEAVAAALDEAALAAARRGAPDAAADLSEQAQRLTPAEDRAAEDRRRVLAAEYHFAAGNTGRARVLLEEAATRVQAGPGRADVLRRLAKVRYRNDSCAVAAELLTRALDEVGDDVALRAGIERDLAWAVTLCGDVADAAEHASSALRIIGERSADPLFPELLAARSMAEFLLGAGLQAEPMRRSVELERPTPQVPIEWRPSMMLAMMQKWSGELVDARRRFGKLLGLAAETGEETSLPFLLSQMSETDTLAGNLTDALANAEEGRAMALQTGQEPIRAVVLYVTALAEAHLGRVDDARASARAGLELSEKVGSVLTMMLNQSTLGFIELSLDDPAAAHERLGPLLAWRDVVGIREPGVVRFVPDEVEALVSLGHLARADEVLAPYEADAARLGRSWGILAASRCRALLLAATGDAATAAAVLEEALKEHGPRAQAFDRARAQLVLGTIHRRTPRRKAGRASLEQALEGFKRLGARLWSAKAQRMLGGSAHARDAAGAPRLTPAERRVAALVASGATNRATADRLFVSVRAVEVHLTSIYRKLGISSRTELAARMGQGAGSLDGDGTLPVSGRRLNDRERPRPGGMKR